MYLAFMNDTLDGLLFRISLLRRKSKKHYRFFDNFQIVET
jgi:hypothetical protein